MKKIFQTVEELDAYFDQDCLPCLLCGRSYRTLHTHLLKTHHMAADDYHARHGIPWTRGLLTKSLGDIYAVHT